MSLYHTPDGEVNSVAVGFTIGGTILGIILIWIVVSMAFIPIYDRYQARQDAQNKVLVNSKTNELAIQNANNQVLVNEITIKQQEQNILVEKQKAQIRIVDAEGIAAAQKIIAASLTDSYLQYLAIDAQKAMANGANHTEIYIPSGPNGIPLVKTIGQ